MARTLLALGARAACGLLLAAGLVALSLAASGAPVPKAPPAELSAEALVGTWRYEYGQMREGSITLFSDHSYQAYHEEHGAKYIGLWWVSGASVTIHEYHYRPDTNEVGYGPQTYTYTFRTVTADRLAGSSAGGLPVVLSNPQR